MKTKSLLLIVALSSLSPFVYNANANTERQSQENIKNFKSLQNQQMLVLVNKYHRELEYKYNIDPPVRYHVLENYSDIASMYGPKGFYTPSHPQATAICYGVYIHPNGRVLPDPQYADATTLENTSRALKRRHDLAKLEYLSIKRYNQEIAQARLLETQ